MAPPPPDPQSVNPRVAARLAEAHAFVLKHFRRVPTLVEIAGAAGFSPYHFHRLYRRAYGKTAKQVMLELQVAEAQRLLLSGVAPETAARSVGFAHQSHMTQRFKKVVGTSPGRWLRESRRPGDGTKGN